MSNPIDRQAAIRLITGYNGVMDKSVAKRLLIQMPSAQRWIPVTERLPEIGKKVLLSESNTMFIAAYHGSGDPEGVWLVDGYVDEYHHYLADVNRCEWMPLPDRGKGI